MSSQNMLDSISSVSRSHESDRGPFLPDAFFSHCFWEKIEEQLQPIVALAKQQSVFLQTIAGFRKDEYYIQTSWRFRCV